MKLTDKLSGKNILFFSVQTFGYEKIIANGLRSHGAHVDYFDERPANSIFAKGIIRLKRSLYQKRIDNYYKRILKETAKIKYDYLFVIRGEVVPAFFLEEFKIQNPGCIFLFYTWDSFRNHAHPVSILDYFDKKFTFDSNDAKKYHLSFRPLFYMQKYEEIRKENTKTKYDLLFIGTAHSDRYRISETIANWCSSNGLSSYTYYYMHSRLVYFFKKIFDQSFERFSYQKLSFQSLKKDEVIELYRDSSVILDINHPNQKGLTMRTFEALGAGKKIITTNNEIKKYPFYDEQNIYVINREHPEIDKDFFANPFKHIDDKLFFKMSIEGWLADLFVEHKSKVWTGVMNSEVLS